MGSEMLRALSMTQVDTLGLSVGVRVDEVGLGGPLWSPDVVRLTTMLVDERAASPPPGDHKGPPFIHTTLAPTDHPASGLASRLRLMLIGADKSAPTAALFRLAVVDFCYTSV